MKTCQRRIGQKTVTVLSLEHGFIVWWHSDIESGGHIHQPFMVCIVQVQLEIWRLPEETMRCPGCMDRLCHVLCHERFGCSDIGAPHKLFSVLGKQHRGQRQQWEESSSGFGAAFQLQLSCCGTAVPSPMNPVCWSQTCLPDCPRGAPSPWPAPAWLCSQSECGGQVPAAGCPTAGQPSPTVMTAGISG